MMDLIWQCIKPILFRFDAEKVHRVLIALIRIGFRLGGGPLRIASGASRPRASTGQNFPTVFGMPFRSRVGLAAGFDKDAEILGALPHLGFGFAEIGTVTPRPQSGNSKPRLFREPGRQAIFNRMGFNGAGADAVSRELRAIREAGRLPTAFRVGVNVGKNKDTSLENAAHDYGAAIQPFRDLADYVVINVSSPNTPGLRSLQTAENLKPILDSAGEALQPWKNRPPLLLKLAPELSEAELSSIVKLGESRGISGWVISNTLGGKWTDGGVGGWSGAPLREISRECLVMMRGLSRLPIISVGGIMSAAEGRRRIELGADLVQVYSGWIYEGPRFPVRLSAEINPELDTASRSSLPLK